MILGSIVEALIIMFVAAILFVVFAYPSIL